MWEHSPGTIEKLVLLLCKHTNLETLPYRVVRTWQHTRQHTFCDNTLTDDEYDMLITLFEDLGEPVLAYWIKILRSDTQSLNAHDTSAGAGGQTSCSLEDTKTTTTTIALGEASSEFVATNNDATPSKISENTEDELDYGDSEKESDAESEGELPRVIFTMNMIELLQPPLSMINGKVFREVDLVEAKSFLSPIVELSVPVEQVSQCIFDMYYEEHPNRATQLCQVVFIALEMVASAVTTTERQRAVISKCIDELETIYRANRAARGVAREKIPGRIVTWTHLRNVVSEHVGAIVSSLDTTSDADLRRAVRMSLYVLENGAPRGFEYGSLTTRQASTNDNEHAAVNVYDHECGEISLGHYPTVDAYGVHKFKTGRDTQAILDELIRRRSANTQGGDDQQYLLSNTPEPYTEDEWHNLCASDFKRVYNKNLTIRVLRHSYVHHRNQAGEMKSPCAKARLASLMGMSLPDIFAHLASPGTRDSPVSRKRKRSKDGGSDGQQRTMPRRNHRERHSVDGRTDTISTVSMESGEIVAACLD